MSRKKIKIALTGGGTGGHTIPLIAVVRELSRRRQVEALNLNFTYIGPRQGSQQIKLEKNIQIKLIVTGKFRRYITFSSILFNFIDLFKILIGFLQTFFYLIFDRPSVIFSKGGYGSFPTVVTAWILKVPVILHESDSILGATNKILSRFEKKIVLSFSTTTSYLPKEKLIVLGNPIRTELFGGNLQEAKKEFAIQSDKPVLLVTGGSQGARQINDLVLKNLKTLAQNYEIIHQAGEKNYSSIQKTVSDSIDSYHVYAFLNENQMKLAYAISQLIVARAGAGIFEKAALGKPSILIPLPTSAAGHQLKNAQIYEEAGACIVLDPFSVTPNQLLNTINQLMANKQRLQTMSEAALRFSKPNAARDIAKLILKTVDDKQK